MKTPDPKASSETVRPRLIIANSFSPKAERQILTEGYQPQGSDIIPETVPELISAVRFPAPPATPLVVNKPSAPYQAPAPDKS